MKTEAAMETLQDIWQELGSRVRIFVGKRECSRSPAAP